MNCNCLPIVIYLKFIQKSNLSVRQQRLEEVLTAMKSCVETALQNRSLQSVDYGRRHEGFAERVMKTDILLP